MTARVATDSGHMLKVTEPTQFQIVEPSGKPLLTIRADGRWEFADDAAPTEAARVFVREVQRIVAGQPVAIGAATRALLMHADTYEDAPLIHCMCDVPNLTITEHAIHVAQVLASAGLLRTPPGAEQVQR